MSLLDPGPLKRSHVLDLARHTDAPAVVLDDRVLSYAELDGLVRERADLLGGTRRLVLVECANELEPVVTYLAALTSGHPVLLVPGRTRSAADEAWERIISAYDPDVVFSRGSADEWSLHEVRAGSGHEVHPELAVLLGTSGSTGSPKLVRLSHENLASNAAAIAGYLELGPSSRAATTLPLQYCYGLSVVNSHLLAGGSLWLTDRSVVDADFWPAFERAGATSFAGVPHTFDLLERSGTDWLSTPTLRQVTQAGGALTPQKVRALALASQAHDVSFVVMYGQTEATARMAYLPPHLAAERPDTIGVAIEGGELSLEDGELVYTGPNVMLGYAESPDDLALGRVVTRLRTGDLAVQHDDGLWQITGRCNRLAKLFGTRLDLDVVEELLAEDGLTAWATASTPDVLDVFVTDRSPVHRVRAIVTGRHCLPDHAVRVTVVPELPRTPSGKPDRARLVAAEAPAVATSVASALSTVFGRAVGPGDSFVGLGGDSLSYVEASVRLERLLGSLPADWPHRTVRSLTALTPRPRRHLAMLETPVLLRALAIVMVVGSHTELFDLMGGAHVLLVLAGYNLARFGLAAPTRGARVRAMLASVRDVLVPSALFITGVNLVTGDYRWSTALMLNEWLDPAHWDDNWRFWFIAVFTWGTVAACALVLLPGVHALQRRRPFAFASGVLAACLGLRFALTGLVADRLEVYQLGTAAWCLALGWVCWAARSRAQRALVTVLAPACVLGYFAGNQEREVVVLLGVLLLLWVPSVPVPRPLVLPLGAVASASFFIYLTHWVVYPPLDADHDFWAAAASVAVGILASHAWTRLRLLARPAGSLGVATAGKRQFHR